MTGPEAAGAGGSAAAADPRRKRRSAAARRSGRILLFSTEKVLPLPIPVTELEVGAEVPLLGGVGALPGALKEDVFAKFVFGDGGAVGRRADARGHGNGGPVPERFPYDELRFEGLRGRGEPRLDGEPVQPDHSADRLLDAPL